VTQLPFDPADEENCRAYAASLLTTELWLEISNKLEDALAINNSGLFHVVSLLIAEFETRDIDDDMRKKMAGLRDAIEVAVVQAHEAHAR
jgi:hypothetical protein